jgi:pyruvate dehydrogenase E2 component (dihydrolipoamide acetyltransferase)
MEDKEIRRLPLTRIQKLIGRTMLEAKQTKAFGYFSVWADATKMVSMRKEYSRKSGIRVTTNDLILCAMARAAGLYPQVCAKPNLQAGVWEVPERIGLGFAVAAPQGLVVPVIQDAGRMTLAQIAQASDGLLRRARANQLTPDDFDGATLVLSGLGMYGIEWFYAIAPPSANGIVSIGFIADEVVPESGVPVIRKQLNVSLAIDQCAADECTAAAFLRKIADFLEEPQTLTETDRPFGTFDAANP